MSPPRFPMVAVVALLLGVADLLFLNLYLAPRAVNERPSDQPAASGLVADAGLLSPDAVTPPPALDAAPQRSPDAATPGADAGAPAMLDAGLAPTPDASAPAVDASVPAVDASVPAVDASVPAVDASVPPTVVAGFKPKTSNLFFGPDRATIKTNHRKLMDAAVAHLRAYPQSVAVVVGYADASETKYGTKALVKRRVKKVVRYLQDNNISPDRIRAFPRGKGTASESRLNRRVNLRIEVP